MWSDYLNVGLCNATDGAADIDGWRWYVGTCNDYPNHHGLSLGMQEYSFDFATAFSRQLWSTSGRSGVDSGHCGSLWKMLEASIMLTLALVSTMTAMMVESMLLVLLSTTIMAQPMALLLVLAAMGSEEPSEGMCVVVAADEDRQSGMSMPTLIAHDRTRRTMRSRNSLKTGPGIWSAGYCNEGKEEMNQNPDLKDERADHLEVSATNDGKLFEMPVCQHVGRPPTSCVNICGMDVIASDSCEMRPNVITHTGIGTWSDSYQAMDTQDFSPTYFTADFSPTHDYGDGG